MRRALDEAAWSSFQPRHAVRWPELFPLVEKRRARTRRQHARAPRGQRLPLMTASW